MITSGIESHFFPPLQDVNIKLGEELATTKTDLSEQLMANDIIYLTMDTYSHEWHKGEKKKV